MGCFGEERRGRVAGRGDYNERDEFEGRGELRKERGATMRGGKRERAMSERRRATEGNDGGEGDN